MIPLHPMKNLVILGLMIATVSAPAFAAEETPYALPLNIDVETGLPLSMESS